MLNEILTLDVYRLMLIFTRVGAALMVMPGFGSQVINTRFRLLLALAVSLLLLPVIGPALPPLPRSQAALLLLVVGEVTVGAFLGILVQMLISVMHVAGTFIGFQIGLTNAFSFDAVAEQQSSTLTAFLNTVAIVVILASDLHHLMLRAMVDTYALLGPGETPPLGDMTETLSHLLSAAFGFAIKISAPLLAFGLIFYAALGLMSRMAPQIQVFFVVLPLQVMAGLGMLMVTLPLMMLLFMRWFEDGLVPYLVPR
ncbi:flagellar biosynthetic protein FliR [Magnetospirillum sp. UT-4]|uniref:flagellar biosynthetic protein FliR n=1 Tax=Magnetospirillum sp. UT-4 TaxID=2681467 RepID=UPI00137E8044|nr:flagellar biosynthetic protein FliR [Magnetospirillum sp. UT-4]CAA7612796.1 Flagellar biosynthetic protein fliR [Magnetospirillum sp. UT-4]